MSKPPAYAVAAGIREYIGTGTFNRSEDCILELAAEKLERLDWTPCDRPYAECTSCGGTGKIDGDPCSLCVWKRWAEDNRANLKTSEELEAEREDETRTETVPNGEKK